MADFDEFKDVQRTPKARDGYLQEGRPHPALRIYGATYGEAVDLETARGRMAARKKGELGIIKGGLDDNDPDLEVKGVGFPGPYEAGRIFNKPARQSAAAGAPEPPSPQSPPDAPHAHAQAPGPSAEAVMASLLSSPPGSVEAMVDIEDDPLYGMEDRPPPHAGVQSPDPEKDRLRAALRKASERISSLQAKLSRKSPAEEYSCGRVRVEVATDSMTFSVSAVDCIRGASGVVLLLPTAGDSMTFIPSAGSRAVLSCHERSSVDECEFTGVSFPIPAIGVLGLVFQRARRRPAPVAARDAGVASDAPPSPAAPRPAGPPPQRMYDGPPPSVLDAAIGLE